MGGMINKILGQFIFCIVIFVPAVLSAQVNGADMVTTIYERDTLSNKKEGVDSALVGRNIFQYIQEGGNVAINQSGTVEAAFSVYLEKNAEKKKNGYRIRIYFDNKQTARSQSEEIEKLFSEQFPQYPVYRTYTNPYFKVAVGDFRTKSDAVRVLEIVRGQYPKAFIIKDIINYPL